MQFLFGVILSSFFVFLGLYVWKKGSVNFLAGYQKETITHEKRLAKNIGLVIIAFGIESALVIGIFLYIYHFETFYFGILAMIHVLIILSLFIMNQFKRYI